LTRALQKLQNCSPPCWHAAVSSTRYLLDI